MCDDILDAEISIPNYHVTRCDRNRNGGGLAFYVKNSLFSQVILSCPLNLEFVLFSVQSLSFSYKMHVGLFIAHQVPLLIFLIGYSLVYWILMFLLFLILYS